EMIDNCEIARRLPIAMHSHALIDGGEVIQHLVRPIYFFLEKAEQGGREIFRNPKSRYAILRRLRRDSTAEPLGNLLRDGWDGDHTSSGSLSTVAFWRDGRIRSRMDGRGARTVSCGPTTQ